MHVDFVPAGHPRERSVTIAFLHGVGSVQWGCEMPLIERVLDDLLPNWKKYAGLVRTLRLILEANRRDTLPKFKCGCFAHALVHGHAAPSTQRLTVVFEIVAAYRRLNVCARYACRDDPDCQAATRAILFHQVNETFVNKGGMRVRHCGYCGIIGDLRPDIPAEQRVNVNMCAGCATQFCDRPECSAKAEEDAKRCCRKAKACATDYIARGADVD